MHEFWKRKKLIIIMGKWFSTTSSVGAVEIKGELHIIICNLKLTIKNQTLYKSKEN